MHLDPHTLVDGLPSWMSEPAAFGVAPWQVLGLLLALGSGAMVRAASTKLLASRVAVALARHGDHADAQKLARVARPVGTMLLCAVVWYALPLLELGPRASEILLVALRLVVTTTAVLMIYRTVDLVSDVFSRRAEKTESKIDDQLIPLIRKCLKVFVACLGFIFVLQNLNVDVASLLAGASLGGLAFTLAARDTVANLFGSISIFADQPFQVGDYVAIDGKEGIVLEVGMRSTRIRTFYESVLAIPNAVIANAVIDNYSMRRIRRQMATVRLVYGTPPDRVEAFVEGVRRIMRETPAVRDEGCEVHFKDLGESALEILLYYFLKVDSWSGELRERQAINLRIMRLAEELDVTFALPARTVHLERAKA
jgi:MscS family membrane protein